MKKQKQERNFLQKYFLVNLRLLIVLHQKHVRIVPFVKYTLYFFGMFQSAFFYVYPTISQSDVKYHNFLPIYLIRPDLIFIDDAMLYVNKDYLFLIPLLTFFCFDIIILQGQVLLEFANKDTKDTQNQQIEIKGKMQKMLINLKSLYSQLYIVYLYIPAQVLAIASFSRYSILSNIGIAMFSIITLIITFLNQILKLYVSNTTLDLNIKVYERMYFSKLDLFREIFVLIQTILYGVLTDTHNVQIAQGILAILYGSTFYFNIYVERTLFDQKLINIVLLTQSIALSLIVSSLLNKWELGLLCIPLLLYITVSENHKQLHYINENIFVEKNSESIAQFMAFSINQKQHDFEKTSSIRDSVILYQHKQKCSDSNCFCQINLNNTSDPNKVVFLSDRLFKQFILQKIKHWNKQLNQLKNDSSSYQCIYYISTLSYFGFTILAFQECNRLLTQTSQTFKGFISHSDYNSHSQSHQLSMPSQSSESRSTKQNQVKLQEINAKSIEKQQKIKLNVSKTYIDMISLIKLKILNKDIRASLQNNFLGQSTKQQEETTEAIELYLQSETQNQNVKYQIIKCLQQKLQFYVMILSKKGLRAQQLFRNAKIISNSLYILEKELLLQYQKFPSQKIQSVNCFLQSELLNNYLSAFRLSNFSTIADEKLINLKKNLKINLFGKQVVHLILNLADNLQSLLIRSFSNNTHEFLEQSYDDFIKNKTIDPILPQGIKNEHYMFVQKFLNDGKSKYFRNADLSFFQLQNGFIKPFNLIVDIILNQSEHLSFVTFFEEVSLTNAYILVDVNGVCGGITQNLLEKTGWKQQEIKQLSNKIIAAFQTNILSLIPEFNDLKIVNANQKSYNVSINLLTKKTLSSQELKSFASFHDSWKHSLNLNNYKANIIIYSREILGYYYYIIEIEDLRQTQTFLNNSTDKNGVTIQLKETENENESQQILDISQISDSEPEAAINKPNSFNVFQYSNSEIQDEENFTQKQRQLNFAYLFQQNQNPYSAQQLVSKNRFLQNQEEEEQNKNPFPNFDATPNQSIRKLIDTSKSFGQQQFFNNDVKELDQSNSKISDIIKNQMKDVNQLYDVDLNKIDKEMRENIQLQLQLEDDQRNQNSQAIDDAASQVSSLIGLKKSIFYKKYELINRLIDSKISPVTYKWCNILFLLSQILVIIYSIIILQNLNTDFNRFIQEVDMLLFSYSFMTPFDIFLALRFSTVYYQVQVSGKIMNSSDYTILSLWLANHLGEGYDDMKQNFLEQFSNTYLLDFFTDQDFDVQFMKENSTSMYQKTLSFRESLNVLLQYQYQFKIGYLQKVSLTQQAFTAYPYANYLNLHDKFDNMTNEILDYTKERKQIVYENWTMMWIPFVVINFLLIIGAYHCYSKYLELYESFLNLFKFADEVWLNRDIERYKILINILTKNSDVMFKYQFDLEQKEKFMMTEKYKKEAKIVHEAKKKKSQQHYDKLPVIYGLIGFSFTFSVFFIPSLLIWFQTKDYLNKYANTADIYKFTGDLCFQLPGLFSQRQFLYWWSVYGLPVTDKPRMTARLFQTVDNLKEFDILVQQFNQENYLTTDDFLNQLNSITTSPVCDFFSDGLKQDFEFYCTRSFDGALTQGLSQSLMYIANQYKVTYALNNFTSIVQYFRYESEGMYIIVKGLISLVSSLKVALLQATHSHMDSIIGLSLFLLIFQFLLLFIQYFILHKYYVDEYDLVRRYMLLLPSSTLLLDDNFERNIRIFYAQFQM